MENMLFLYRTGNRFTTGNSNYEIQLVIRELKHARFRATDANRKSNFLFFGMRYRLLFRYITNAETRAFHHILVVENAD